MVRPAANIQRNARALFPFPGGNAKTRATAAVSVDDILATFNTCTSIDIMRHRTLSREGFRVASGHAVALRLRLLYYLPSWQSTA